MEAQAERFQTRKIDMDNLYYIVIYIVVIMVIGSLIAYVIYMYHRYLDTIRDSLHSIAEDFEAISKDLKEINRMIEENRNDMKKEI